MQPEKIEELSKLFNRYQQIEVEIKQLNLLAMKAADGVGEIEFSLQVKEPIEDVKVSFCETFRDPAMSFFERMKLAEERLNKPTHISTAFHKEIISDSLTLEILGCILHEKNLEKEWLEKRVRRVYNETFNP